MPTRQRAVPPKRDTVRIAVDPGFEGYVEGVGLRDIVAVSALRATL